MKALFSRRKASGTTQSSSSSVVVSQAKTGKENRPVASLTTPPDDHHAGPSTASEQRRPSSKASYRSRFSSLTSRRPTTSYESAKPEAESHATPYLDRPPSRLSVQLAGPSHSSYRHVEGSLDEEDASRAGQGIHASGDQRRVKFDSTALPDSSSSTGARADGLPGHNQRSRAVSMYPDLLPHQPVGDRSVSQASDAGSTRRKFSLPPLSSLRPAPRPPSAVSSSRASPTKSLLSPAPSEASSRAASSTGYLPQAQNWSDMAGDDLVANLGPKERARQEVLWEIVSSEERYVQELVKLNDTFCRALLPPSFYSPSLDVPRSMSALSRALSPTETNPGSSFSPTSSRSNSFDQLPIAAQYSSKRYSTGSRNVSDTSTSSALASVKEEDNRGQRSSPEHQHLRGGQRDAYEVLTHGRPVNSSTIRDRSGSSTDTSRKQRAHKSLPPTQSFTVNGARIPQAITTSISGRSFLSRRGSGSRAASRSSHASLSDEADVLPPDIPEDLRQVLEVLAGGILQGHLKLAKALRKRFDDQYPLVRSLADVFHAHAGILREYATYVLHLEAALSQADLLLSHAQTASTSRRHSKTLSSHPSGKLSMLLLSLEELAADRGESGLSISLSKSFQRLLRYPLLFQNLLFNTDPSMKEYERTLDMVDEVEQIVRGIEDEKVDYEEKERTRDAWARIDGLEGDMALVAPKPYRLLVSESQVDVTSLEDTEPVKQHKLFQRLSELLQHPEHEDHWLVRFTDVTLLCQRTGTTSLPISSRRASARSSENDLSEMPLKSARTRRTTSVKPRNLYRFVKVAEWHIPDKALPAIVASPAQKELPPVPVDRVSQDFEAMNTPVSPSDPRDSGAPVDQGIAITNDEPATPRRAARNSAAPMSSQETPRRRVALKTSDGPSTSRTPRAGRDSDNATLVSDRLSVMSFAYQSGDQVRPIMPVQPLRLRPKSAAEPANKTFLRPSRATSTAPSGVPARPKRLSAGHLTGKAADAKFANRLRVADMAAEDDSTVRPANRAVRSSLPPAMLQRPRPTSAASAITSGPSAQDTLRVSEARTVRPKASALGPRGAAEKSGQLPPWNAGSGLAPRNTTTLGTKVVPLMGTTPDRKTKATAAPEASSPAASRSAAGRNLGGRI